MMNFLADGGGDLRFRRKDQMEQESERHSLPVNRAIVLKNKTCVYCGSELDPASYTKEHVIGRRFVPKGKLEAEWNLIVRACEPCNHAKSDLEDDISAITLQPDAWGRHPKNDTERDADAIRKAERCVSRRTGKLVKESDERLGIEVPFGFGGGMSFSLVSRPQLDDDRAFQLCAFHSRAFFYWMTFNKTSLKGGFWPGAFFPVQLARRSDWGNAIQRTFMDSTSTWEPRVVGIAASGYFKVAIRKHPSVTCWSWAYEWNLNVRAVGFFGNEVVLQELADRFPTLDCKVLRRGNEITRYREETPISEEDDRLFAEPENCTVRC
jgi:hypothetical protein